MRDTTGKNTVSPDPSAKTPRKLPRSIWALGFGSLFMDTSSELIHSLLPLFMSTVLGASMLTIGLVEGFAESVASLSKVASGFLSDRIGKRKAIIVAGYSLSALTKPIFPLAGSIVWVFAARMTDRIGKGIRGAPRDALIADSTSPSLRGAAYGLRQSLDSVGAFLGPMLALAFMALFADDIRSVLWVSFLPACIAVAILAIAVREPKHVGHFQSGRSVLSLKSFGHLGRAFWFVTALGAVFTLARFSEAFLILRAQSVGMAPGLAPVVMIVMNVVYSLSAYPAGAAADRVRRRTLLLSGLVALIGADVILALATNPWHILGGSLLWGLQMGLTQGLFSKMVSEAVPDDLRGSAFGVFNLVSGGALLAASMTAGLLWEIIGPGATFWTGASFSALTAIGVAWSSRLLGARPR